MLFNSLPFLLFLPVVFLLYWFVFKKSLTGQNLLLLIASYFFYGWWDYRFLGLIAASTLVDYFIGLALKQTTTKKRRKILLLGSLLFNLGLLAIFKYFNFFIESWIDAGEAIGFRMHLETLQLILPVGISFYTFQTLSYTIDVYRKRIEPTSDIVKFSTYVAFFPQLIAGPIERASNLLPQFSKQRNFDFEFAKSGAQLIVWGLFQKMVIADNCATYVNAIFNNYENLNSLTLGLGAVYFAFQIYGDFAGYSNIAIGTARLLGFDLMRNFNYPYFSRDIGEFWRRWHISLSTWFRDYLYIPLGGSRGSMNQQVRNVFIIFIVSGFWHGANWTFIAWGALHAFYFIPLLIMKINRNNLDTVASVKGWPGLKNLSHILLTFVLTTIAWIFFRSPSITEAIFYLYRLISSLDLEIEYLSMERYSIEILLLLGLFVMTEWSSRHKEQPLSGRFSFAKTITVTFLIFILGVFSDHSEFIYFQF